MTRSRILALAAAAPAAAALVALGAPAASADTTAPLYAKMRQRFTTSAPGAATGWRFDGRLKQIAAGRPVPPQRSVDFVFPRGTRIRPAAVPACDATDEQLASAGPGACPPRSRVARGTAGLFLGPASSVAATLTAFAAGRELVLVFTTDTGAVLRVLRGTVQANRIRATIPRVVLAGGYEAAIYRFRLAIPKLGTAKRPLIRTPSTCPRSRRWTFTYLPRYDPPFGVQRSTSTTRCSPR